MHPLVNSSLGAIGNRTDINADWPAVHWLVANWAGLFGPPTPMEQSLGDPTGLQWAVYLYALYALSARRAGPGGHWADPGLLNATRNVIHQFAAQHPPTPAAPIAQCGPGILHPMVASTFNLLQAPPSAAESPAAIVGDGFLADGAAIADAAGRSREAPGVRGRSRRGGAGSRARKAKRPEA